MKVTKEDARKVKDYIFKSKRNADIINKQLYDGKKQEPFMCYMIGLQKGFKFTFTTEADMERRIKEGINMVAYCKIDRGLYNLYQMYEYKEIDLNTYLEKTAQYIQGTIVKRTDYKEKIARSKAKRKLNL